MKTFEVVSDGKRVLRVAYDGRRFETALPAANFESTDIETPLVQECDFGEFFVTAEIYVDRIVVYSETDDLEFSIDEAEEIEERGSFFHHYVPVVKYTQGTQAVLNEIFSGKKADTVVVPLLDIRYEKNLAGYLSDTFAMTHFLDLCALSYESNTREREEVKNLRKDHKKRYGSIEGAPKIPPSEYEMFSSAQSVSRYDEIESKDFIPVCRIETANPATVEYGRHITSLFARFGRAALRVMNTEKFDLNFETYLLPVVEHLSNLYIIVECNKNDTNDKEIMVRIKSVAPDATVVYVRETTDYDSNKILLNSENIFPNRSLKIYQDIVSDFPSVWYGDYLGFDRDTAIEFVPGMKPNASAYLLKIDDGMEIAVLKIKHEAEVKTANTKKSMTLLQEVWLPKFAPVFIDENHCGGCRGLLKEPLNLAKAKQFCQIHNGTVLANI